MQTQHGPFLLAFMVVSLACPGADGPLTGNGSTSSGESTSGEPASSSSGDEPTDTGVVDPDTSGGSSGSSGGTSEGSGGSSSEGASEGSTAGETGSATDTSGGSSETGAVECEPAWAVPRVPADALAVHDLAWIGCEFTACDPGESGLLCAPFVAADAPLTYLGHMHINDTGAFTTDDVVAPNNFSWLDGQRHIYRYDESIYIMTVTDEPADQLDVFYTARALEILRADHAYVYEQLLTVPGELPAGPPLDGFNWKNRLRSVVLSYDTSPLYIAAGLTVLDADPVKIMNLDAYSNVAAISVDSETIRGESPDVGSRPIYKKPSNDENFLRYMREGVVETLVHELLHTRVDRLNSVDADMQLLWARRGDPNACATFELEEALVAASSLLHFRESGQLSDTYLDYYDLVLDQNLAKISACPDAAMWDQQFSMPSGVDVRYDLRIFDLE